MLSIFKFVYCLIINSNIQNPIKCFTVLVMTLLSGRYCFLRNPLLFTSTWFWISVASCFMLFTTLYGNFQTCSSISVFLYKWNTLRKYVLKGKDLDTSSCVQDVYAKMIKCFTMMIQLQRNESVINRKFQIFQILSDFFSF